MTPWLGALFLVLALRGLARHWARFRPPETETETETEAGQVGGTPPEPPSTPQLHRLLETPHRLAVLGHAILGVAILGVCDQSPAVAWGLAGAACAWPLLLRRRLRAPEAELTPEDDSGERKRLRIASVRASGRMDVVWFYSLPLLLPSLILLVRARTWRGALFSLTCVLLPLALVLVSARRPRAGAASAALALALLGGLWGAVPRGDPGAIESRFLSERPATWTPAALVPEEDQFQLGTFVLPLLDAHVDWEQSVRVRRVFGSVYDRVAQDPDLAGLPSVLSATYRDMAGLELPHHAYFYVPPGPVPEGGHPVLLFFHGSLGSFQGYLAALRPLAERERFAIVAPSYGSGLWRRKASAGRIEEALDLVAADLRLDSTRVVAVGLSAGGSAVSRVGARFPQRVRGLAFLSPMIEPALFAEHWRQRPVLVVHGTTDRRIPAGFVEGAVRDLEAGEVQVRYLPVESQDHFLYFADTERVNAALGDWLRQIVPR